MRPIITLFILVASALVPILQAQACLPGGITFTRQSAIDSFPLLHPGCRHIEGPLTIMGEDISYLDSLAQLQRIGGTLTITQTTSLSSLEGLHNIYALDSSVLIDDNESLTDLLALSNLTEIKGMLSVWFNPGLPDLNDLQFIQRVWGVLRIGSNFQITTLQPLSNLTLVADNIVITNNDRLKNMEGLEGLTEIQQNLRIAYHDSLTSFEGLHNIHTVIGSLDMDLNPRVTDYYGLRNLWTVGTLGFFGMETADLHGFDNLVYITDALNISASDSLKSFDGMPKVERVGGFLSIHEINGMSDLTGFDNIKYARHLRIRGNESLKSLYGLHNLESISSMEILHNNQLEELTALADVRGLDYFITAIDNPKLTSLRGIDSLCSMPIQSIDIRNGASLSICNNPCICTHLLNGGAYTIEMNMPGCNSREEIIGQCLATASHSNQSGTSISITPNPVIDELIISGIPADAHFTIYSVTEENFLGGHINDRHVNVESLPAALYVIHIFYDRKIVTQRFVKL